MQQLSLPVALYDFQIRRSRRAKRLRVSITPLGTVEVVAPRNASSSDVKHFIQAQETWISRRKSEIDSIRSQELNDPTPRIIRLPAIREHWQVSYTQGLPELQVLPDPGPLKNDVTKTKRLRLSCRHEDEASELLKRWLTCRAKATLLPWLQQTSQETGLIYKNATIRGQKSRWASCSSRKNISLNRCMLFLEAEQVRYLMVHELCHTREMNHSARFWRLVDRFCPEYRTHEKAVNACCYRLPRWAF